MSDQKRGKSQQGGLAPSSFQTTVRRARVSRASHAWQARAIKGSAKIGGFTTSRNLGYTTRANIAHEKAEQIRARIVCTPAYIGVAGVGKVSALTGQKVPFFIFSVGYAWVLTCSGRRPRRPVSIDHCSPAKKHNVIFSFLALLLV